MKKLVKEVCPDLAERTKTGKGGEATYRVSELLKLQSAYKPKTARLPSDEATAKSTPPVQPPPPKPKGFNPFKPVMNDVDARAVDLFPRQAALNVNGVHDKVNRISISGFLGLVGGFGAKTQFERQRELFENYIQQDVFASAFGKGRSEFGWTFAPLPGSRQVSPGLKTTYAAIIVPAQAKAVLIEGAACTFKRKNLPEVDVFTRELPESCVSTERPFLLKVPSQGEGFSLRRVEYRQVDGAETATVKLEGEYFSPQVGVLIDGAPLRNRSSGLAQTDFDPLDGQSGTKAGFRGEFEYINQNLIMLRFAAANPTSSGTPRITLITPRFAGDINGMRVTVNVSENTTLDEQMLAGHGMFTQALAVSTVRWISADRDAGTVKLDLVGTGFVGPDIAVDVNGQPATSTVIDARTIRIAFVAQPDKLWTITVTRPGALGPEASQPLAVENPLIVKAKTGIVAFVTPPTGENKERALLRLPGGLFDQRLDRMSVRGATLLADSVSIAPAEVVAEVSSPGKVVLVELTRRVGPAFLQKISWRFEKETGDASTLVPVDPD